MKTMDHMSVLCIHYIHTNVKVKVEMIEMKRTDEALNYYIYKLKLEFMHGTKHILQTKQS